MKNQTLDKTAHRYTKQPVWTWADDFSTATATFTCDNCRKGEPVEAVIIDSKMPGSDCNTPGEITYTATVNFNKTTYTDTRTKELPATHKLTTHVEARDATCEGEGNEEYWQCSVCHKYFGDADGTNPRADIPIIPATGHKLEFVKDNEYHCIICGGTFLVTVTSNGTTRITSVECEGVIMQDAPPQSDWEEEQVEETVEIVSPSVEEQDGGNDAEPDREEKPPQSDAEESRKESAEQPTGGEAGESSQDKQSEEAGVSGQDGQSREVGEDGQGKQSEEAGESGQDGQSAGCDSIMNMSEQAARYGVIDPGRETGKEEYATADVREVNAVKLRAESKGNAVAQTILDRQESSLWESVAVLSVLAGAVLTLLYKGRRTGIKK